MTANRPLRIAVIAGEASGDQLGAGLLAALRARVPDVEFSGVGGPKMQAQGLVSWADQEQLAVMGLFEVLRKLPSLLRLRRQLREQIIDWQPDLFLGIDAPDFNLPLARMLRAKGLTTAHYVSPSVWAWRQGRVHGIRRSIDLMLTLFPFEGDFYAQHDVPFAFVGHTLADRLPMHPDTAAYRRDLDIEGEFPVLGLLPGSRRGEVARIAPDFLAAARLLKQRVPDLRVLIPASNTLRHAELTALMQPDDSAWMSLIEGHSHEVLGASDVVLVASGTATLEAALLKKPMVVGYRFSALTYWVGKFLMRIPWVALPNILAQRFVVPELLQNDLIPLRAADELEDFLRNAERRQQCVESFEIMHQRLGRDADEVASDALLDLIAEKANEAETRA
ncbi:MAG: lipid-A-disaccharide synthase [Natronospirillum sp.]